MISTRTAAVSATVAVTLALILAACGSSDFDSSDAGQPVTKAIDGAGLKVCGEESYEPDLPGAGEGKWYAVSADCSENDAEDPDIVVTQVPYDSQSDRDYAYQALLHRMRRIPGNLAVFTAGDTVIGILRVEDRGSAGDLIEKLEDAGAARGI